MDIKHIYQYINQKDDSKELLLYLGSKIENLLVYKLHTILLH